MSRSPLYKSSVLYRTGAIEILEALDKEDNQKFTHLYQLPVFRTSATLAHRLRELEKAGYIVKSVHNRPGQQVQIYYSLTDTGREALKLHKSLENL